MLADPKFVFTNDELCALEQHLGTNDVSSALKQLFNNSLWITNEKFVALVREPLLRACAWYLYKEKRRNYALNIVGKLCSLMSNNIIIASGSRKLTAKITN